MKNKIINFDGSPIWHFNDNFILNNVEKETLENIEVIKNASAGNLITNNKNIFEIKNLNNIKNFFDKKVQQYIDEVLEIKIKNKLTNSWVTIQTKGQGHHSHYHPNAFISMVYYPQIKNGNIYFSTDKSKLERETNLKFSIINQNEYNSDKAKLKIKQNDAIIFPAWLNHGVEGYGEDDYRVCIAANYWLEGKLGSLEEVNVLVL